MITTIPIILTIIPSLLCQEVLRVTITDQRPVQKAQWSDAAGKLTSEHPRGFDGLGSQVPEAPSDTALAAIQEKGHR